MLFRLVNLRNRRRRSSLNDFLRIYARFITAEDGRVAQITDNYSLAATDRGANNPSAKWSMVQPTTGCESLSVRSSKNGFITKVTRNDDSKKYECVRMDRYHRL